MRNNIVRTSTLRRRKFIDWLAGKNNAKIELPNVKKHGLDFPLLFGVVALCAFGLVMLFSASYYYAQSNFGNGYKYVVSQAGWLAGGFVLLFVFSHIPYTLYAKRFFPLLSYGGLIVLLLAVLAVGKTLQGAQRWIVIGPISMQPSEFARFIIVICLANYLAKRQHDAHRFFKGLVVCLLIAAIPCFLIFIQPNLSMVIIIVINVMIMLVAGGCGLPQLGLLICIGFLGLLVYLKENGGYQSDRFALITMSWEKLLENVGNDSYQVVQSFYAFANGGWFGQGFDASRQKLLFLPYCESDYILAIIGEELGFVGVVAMLIVYFFVIYRGFKIAMTCKERFGSLLAVGMTGTLAVQVVINVAVVTGILPSTGQTLPFISSGGSSVISFLAAIGILLNVSRYTEKTKVGPKRTKNQ